MLPSTVLTTPFKPPDVAPASTASLMSLPVNTAVAPATVALLKELVKVLVRSADRPRSVIKDAPSFIKSIPGICAPI